MTAQGEIGRARLRLLLIAATEAVLWAVAAALLLDSVLRGPNYRFAVTIPFAVVILAVVTWRWRWLGATARVALWLEEQQPGLRYALVTRLDPRFAGLSALDEQIASVGVRPPYADVARRQLAQPLVVATIAAFLFLALPQATSLVRRVTPPIGALERSFPPPLAGLTVRVVAPAYANVRTAELREPETIRALTGSTVTVQGRVAPDGITARVGQHPLVVAGKTWRTRFVLGGAPEALRLRHEPSGRERVIVLEPIRDEPPRVILRLPERDTTLRRAPVRVTVAATVTDDIGLAEVAVEYLVSSGQEETFTARSAEIGRRALAGRRTARIEIELPRAALQLGPGDLLSIRAVARDRNTVTGPGIGTSDTRTIRVARSDEYDSLAVEAAAPVFGDSAMLTQRMILRMTEELVRALPSLSRDSVVNRSASLARDQARLRERVHEIVFPGHSHEETPLMEGEPPDHAEPADPVNEDLAAAYDAMWAAERELGVADPASALPPMRIAVAALDRARLADRLYLRGGSPRLVVDVGRVRLSGTDRGTTSARSARPASDTLWRALAERLVAIARASELAVNERANAIAELRVQLLSVSPRAAAALGEAASAVRAGGDPGPAIARAHAALTGAPVVRTAPYWSGW